MEHVLQGISFSQLHEVCTPYLNSSRKNCFFIIRINDALKSFTHRFGQETSFSNSSHCCFTPVRQVWRRKRSRSNLFNFSKFKMLSMHYINDFAFFFSNPGRFPSITKKTILKMSPCGSTLDGKSSLFKILKLQENHRGSISFF